MCFVVDDEPMIADTLSACLRDWGYRVFSFVDPIRALRDARKLLPDVLITDVEMAAMGGVDLAMLIQADCPACTVMLTSGHIGPIASLENARAKGFRLPLFTKPLSAITIAEQIERMFVTHRQRQLPVSDGLSNRVDGFF